VYVVDYCNINTFYTTDLAVFHLRNPWISYPAKLTD